jgi:hypothetical protein
MASKAEDERELQRLTAEARYARERRDLYRARQLTARPINPTRMRELERTSQRADERLAAARRERGR